MLIRDPHQHGPLAAARACYELFNRERTHAIFLIAEHPMNNPDCMSQILVGVGTENHPEYGYSLRWLGEGLDAGRNGSSLVCRGDDPAVFTAYLQNRISRTCLQAEKAGFKTPAWAFFQSHIRTQADADKLVRYLAGYREEVKA